MKKELPLQASPVYAESLGSITRTLLFPLHNDPMGNDHFPHFTE